MVFVCASTRRPLLCLRVWATGGRRCVPLLPTRPPSWPREPALWCVCGTQRSRKTRLPAWSSDRSVYRWTMTQLLLVSQKIRWSGFSSQLLYGHTDSVTCLAASEVHNLIVSGSRDLTCILWDMEELSYITQLTGHTASISSLAINELTVSSPHSLTVAMAFLSTLLSHLGE